MSTATSSENSISKAVSVLSEVAKHTQGVRFSQLQSDTGLAKATLNRLLNQLLAEHLVRLDSTGQCYLLGFRLLSLAKHSWESLTIRDLAADQMQSLAELSGETVQLAVLQDTHAIYIDYVESSQSVRISVSLGEKIPVYCSGVGKALLAFLAEDEQSELLDQLRFTAFTKTTLVNKRALKSTLKRVKTQGFALDLEEHYVGVCCVAAPILDAQGQPVAALSVSAPSFRVDEAMLLALAKPLSEAVAVIAERLAPARL